MHKPCFGDTNVIIKHNFKKLFVIFNIKFKKKTSITVNVCVYFLNEWKFVAMVRNTMDRYFIFQLISKPFFWNCWKLAILPNWHCLFLTFFFLSFGKLWRHFLMNFKTALLQSDRNVVLFKNFVCVQALFASKIKILIFSANYILLILFTTIEIR